MCTFFVKPSQNLDAPVSFFSETVEEGLQLRRAEIF
jgi:hypothetical protein